MLDRSRRKLAALLLAALLVPALVACDGESSGTQDTGDAGTEPQPGLNETPLPEQS